jgi:hypothetical protein
MNDDGRVEHKNEDEDQQAEFNMARYRSSDEWMWPSDGVLARDSTPAPGSPGDLPDAVSSAAD